MNTLVENYFNNTKKWKNELQLLRKIVLDSELLETYKWKQPCYVLNNKNVLIISCYKDFCCIAFFKGSLINDSAKVLYQQTQNVQSSRLLRFYNTKSIKEIESTIKDYIYQAIAIEKSGIKQEKNTNNTIEIPLELLNKFKENSIFKKSFESLTPGRQRGYYLYFSQAKQSKTKTERIEKYIQQIINGKGFFDCTCGLSKKMPNCDGSHKFINNI